MQNESNSTDKLNTKGECTVKKTKKTFKILLTCLLCVVMLFGLAYVGVGVFGTVDFAEVGACSGGFEPYVKQVYVDEIEQAAKETITPEEIGSANVNWSGRKITVSFINNENEAVNIEGTRYWYGKFKWEKV